MLHLAFGADMSDKLQDFVRETIDELLEKLPAKDRLKGLTPQERLEELSPEEIVKALSPEKLQALARHLKKSGATDELSS